MLGDDIMEFPKASEDVKALIRKMEKVMIPWGENDVKDNKEVWNEPKGLYESLASKN